MTDTPNAERARAVVNAVTNGDLDTVMDQMADDVVWHVGGDHPLSGDYHGKGAVRAWNERVAELTAGSLKLEPIDVLASDQFVGIVVRIGAEAGSAKLDTTMVSENSPEGWRRATFLPDDQAAFDRFFAT
jgi:ketosteroid isomerase-like protein